MCRFLLAKSKQPVKPKKILTSFAKMAEKAKLMMEIGKAMVGDFPGLEIINGKNINHLNQFGKRKKDFQNSLNLIFFLFTREALLFHNIKIILSITNLI